MKLSTYQSRTQLVCLLFALMEGSISGCGSFVDSSTTTIVEEELKDARRANSLEVKVRSSSDTILDAGVVFGDEASYQCVPLSRVGIGNDDKVLSVTSSCECVMPSIVEYGELEGGSARALRIDFQPEPRETHFSQAPASLAVVINLELSNRRKRTCTIKYVHSFLVQASP